VTSLRAEGIVVEYTSPVLRGVDLAVTDGDLTLLAGRNGAGKSTLIRVMAGVEAAQRGLVSLAGVPMADVPPRDRARTIALVPQDLECPFEFTAREYVAMGRYPHLRRFRGPQRDDRTAVERALDQVDAQGFASRAVTTLSGGELRRVGIARALATEARILLLDEPTANLDLEHALALLDLIGGLAAEGRAILVASHDLNLVAPRMSSVALLHDGRIVEADVPERALRSDAVARVFGVDAADPDGYFPRSFRSRDGNSPASSR